MRRRPFSVVGLLLAGSLLLAGCPQGPDDDDDTAPYDGEEIDPGRMYDLLSEIASDDYGGREPSTAGNDMALDVVEAIFAELDLVPAGEDDGYRQYFPWERWFQAAPSELVLDGSSLAEGTDFALLEGSGWATVGGGVVFAGYGLTVPPFDPAAYPDCPLDPGGYDDYAGIDVGGTVALVLRQGPAGDEAIHDDCPASDAAEGDPALWTYGYKAANARAHGAVAMLLVQDYGHGPDLVQGSLGSAYFDPGFPALALHRDVAEAAVPELPDWAAAIDAALAPAPADLGFEASVEASAGYEQHSVANLLGAIEGTDPDVGEEVVVIGAHIDHLGTDPVSGEIYNGADDNASGTVVMIELARVLAGSGWSPARTVLFASFNAEETGLEGSCYYTGAPSYPHEDTVAMVSIDMVGAGDEAGLNLYGALYPDYLWLAQLMDLSAQDIGLPYDTVANVPVLASDHVCFITQEIPAVMAQTTGPHEHYHTPLDTPETNSPGNLAAAAHLMWALLEPLARATEGPYLDEEWEPLEAKQPGEPPLIAPPPARL